MGGLAFMLLDLLEKFTIRRGLRPEGLKPKGQ